MFRTITVSSFLAVQGKYILATQKDTNDNTKTRHVIINSDTLQVRKTFEGESAKDDFQKEIEVILAERDTDNASPLAKLMAATTTATATTATVNTDGEVEESVEG